MEPMAYFMKFYCTVTSGLERISKQEFEEKLSQDLSKIEVFPGKILCTASPQSEPTGFLTKICESLRSIEHIFLVLFSFEMKEGISLESSEFLSEFEQKLSADKPRIQSLIMIFLAMKSVSMAKLIKFRVDIKENLISRIDKNNVAKSLAESLSKTFTCLEPEITEYDLKFSLEKVDKLCFFSIKITHKPLGILIVPENREQTRATMRPSIAYNLCRLMNIMEGDLIIDPMCGSSTIIEIAIREFKEHATYICCDIDEVSIHKSQKNLSNYTSCVDLILCNSARSPFRRGVFDKIVTDMPFGKRCGSHGTNFKTYPALIQEFNRILREGGKSVVVTTEKSLMYANFKKKNRWKRDELFLMNKGGLDTFVVVARKYVNRKKKPEKND